MHIRDYAGDYDASLNRATKYAQIGGLAGVVGDVILGENANDYVEILRQAPTVIRYAVDGGLAIVVGTITSSSGAFIGLTNSYQKPRLFFNTTNDHIMFLCL